MSWFTDIRDFFMQRTESPFSEIQSKKSSIGGAFFFSWIVINWDLVYQIIFIDENSTVRSRINQIQEYINCHGGWTLFWYPLLAAIFSVFIFFLLSIVGMFISNTYHFKILPLISKITSDKHTVTRTEYDAVLAANSKLRDDLTRHVQSANAESNANKVEMDTLSKTKDSQISIIREANSDRREVVRGIDKLSTGQILLAKSDVYVSYKGSSVDNYKGAGSTQLILGSEMPDGWRDALLKNIKSMPAGQWLTHNINLTTEEAMNGETYKFAKDIDFQMRHELFEEIKINILCDDFITLIINKNSAGSAEFKSSEYSGGQDLISIDIKNELVTGVITLEFFVRNVKPDKLISSGSENPYGFVFCILGKLRNDVLLIE